MGKKDSRRDSVHLSHQWHPASSITSRGPSRESSWQGLFWPLLPNTVKRKALSGHTDNPCQCTPGELQHIPSPSPITPLSHLPDSKAQSMYTAPNSFSLLDMFGINLNMARVVPSSNSSLFSSSHMEFPDSSDCPESTGTFPTSSQGPSIPVRCIFPTQQSHLSSQLDSKPGHSSWRARTSHPFVHFPNPFISLAACAQKVFCQS